MTIDLVARRVELLRLREGIVRAAGDLAADDEGVGELSSAGGDQHLADHASDLVDLEVDMARARTPTTWSPRSTKHSGKSRQAATGRAPSAAP